MPTRRQRNLLAVEHLTNSDDRLAEVIERIGLPKIGQERDAWRALSSSIIGQQVSVHAARAIRGRFATIIPGRDFPLPADVLNAPVETLRAAGMSGNKVQSIRDLAAHFEDGRINARKLAKMDDEAVIAALIPVRGIGRWTAEMFLIFGLNRPDVLAVDDLGLRNAMKKLYDLPEIPQADVMREIAEKWRPFRSVASWYLWRSLDNEPKIK
jgi:DNA-3-methyladenine glycosylase II